MKFGFLVFADVEELDFVGPWEMITMWKQVASGPDTCVMVAQTKQPVLCAKGMSVNPHESFESCPQLDYLLVPGGHGTRAEVDNKLLVEFVARQAAGCKAVLSVCTGSFVLHAAGLLAGKKATTHWGALARLRKLEGVTVIEERFTHDDKVWCSAGVSAGIDMTLAFIAATAGDEAAGKVQFASEYFPAAVNYENFKTHPQAPAYVKNG
jgi:transcriptional regulator GlxA family with amidase domain